MIDVFRTETEFITFHAMNDSQNKESIGLVPTMGNLHQGHISLLEKAIEENDIAIITIFVNPTQFSESEDLDLYPRTWQQDLEKVEQLAKKYPHKKVIIFYPESEDVIYPNGKAITFSHQRLRSVLEGELRATHFDGVTTVVKRLFEITKPNKAYFGKKDFQQQVIIKDMVDILNLPISITSLPIVREATGLAMSSRNRYLSNEEKKQALTLYRTLNEVAKLLGNGPNGVEKAKNFIADALTSDHRWNYLELRTQNLETVSNDTVSFVILGNYQLGTTRLLDNIELEIK